MTPRISAIVCTHNRMQYLPAALRSLAQQDLPKSDYEVLVVDNHSTDGTRQCVESDFASEPNFRYIFEPTLGTAYARNTGWRNAQAPIIAYLDDDAIAPSDWLRRILHAFDTVRPEPGCVGGKVDPIWEAPRPAWFPASLDFCITIIDLSPTATTLNGPSIPASVNVAIQRRIFKQLGGFKTNLGDIGRGKKLTGEDELFIRELMKLGHVCYYDPEICVRHAVPAGRLTLDWLTNRMYTFGLSHARIRQHLDPLNLHWRIRIGLKELWAILARRSNRQALRRPTEVPAEVELRCNLWYRLGYAVGLLQVWA